MSGGWLRVNREKRCPICGKCDWCLLSRDGGAAICPRVESPRRCGDAGWLHRLTDAAPRRFTRTITLATSTPTARFEQLADEFQQALDAGRLHQLSQSLGLSTNSLTSFRIGWLADHHAYTFPMRNAGGAVVGIRLRRPDGSKYSVKGGREGLFLPEGSAVSDGQLLIVEGATDAAALLDMGFANVVGRPSCTGGVKLLTTLAKQRKTVEAVVVADSDDAGRRGAENLAAVLVAYTPAVKVIAPPTGIKDIRDWLRAGATLAEVEQAIEAATVRRLKVNSREVHRGK